MNIKTSRYYVISLIIMFVISLFLINSSISANAETTDNSLKLICKTDDVIISGMDWNIYKVSSTKQDDIYQLEGEFADYRISMKNLSTTSEMLNIANTLENYAVLDDIKSLGSATTDSDGIVSFADLETGLYLLSGKSVTIDNKKYTPSAFLVEIVGETNIQLTSYPKFSVKTISNSEVQYSVKKVWLNDDNNLEDRPNDIIIELYKNEEFVEEVTLNNNNNWSYSWSSTDVYEWRVKEVQIPEHYMVIYRNDEVVYLVVNTHESTDNNQHGNTNSQSVITNVSSELTTTSGSGDDISKVTTTTTPNDIVSVSKTDTTTSVIVSESNMTTTTSVTVSESNVTTTTSATVSESNITTTTSMTGSDISKTTTNTNITINSTNNDNSNGSNSKDNQNTTVTTIDKLPQTGQVWLPVPILILVGVVLISIGIQLKSKK